MKRMKRKNKNKDQEPELYEHLTNFFIQILPKKI